MRDYVVYVSRLELARLIFADFDRAVHRILAQPFLLRAKVDGKIRKRGRAHERQAPLGPGASRQRGRLTRPMPSRRSRCAHLRRSGSCQNGLL